jgi:hypothetical protein
VKKNKLFFFDKKKQTKTHENETKYKLKKTNVHFVSSKNDRKILRKLNEKQIFWSAYFGKLNEKQIFWSANVAIYVQL